MKTIQHTLPNVPERLLRVVLARVPEATAWDAFCVELWLQLTGPGRVRQYVVEMVISDPLLPERSKGDFTFGHNGGVDKVDFAQVFYALRAQRLSDVSAIKDCIYAHYRPVRDAWLLSNG